MTWFPRRLTLTFSRRVAHSALFWGVPMILLELVGVPRADWLFVALLAIPATMFGVIAFALIEHWYFSQGKKRDS